MANETDDVARRELIARRAYEIWERKGHPNDQAWEHWLEAEREVSAQSDASGPRDSGSPFADALEHDKRRRQNRQEGGQSRPAPIYGASEAPADGDYDSIEGDGHIEALGKAPPATNLDRALPAGERARARQGRRETPTPASEPPAAEHFIILADHASLRIFVEDRAPGQRTPTLRALQTQLFPEGKESYAGRDTSQQGRFPNSSRRGGAPGQGIDERLPMQQEQERRLVALIAAALTSFLRQHPQATWDFAAGPDLHNAVLETLEPGPRRNLRKVLAKDLSRQPLSSLRVHFASAPSRT